jgi:hypothetical protein
LPGAVAGEKLREDGEILELRNQFFYAHDDDVDGRHARHEPSVAFVGDHAYGSRLRDTEVRAAYADVGGEELLAETLARESGEGGDVGGEFLARRLRKNVRDPLFVHVEDGADDVRGMVARELRDPLPEVRLDYIEVEVSVILFEMAV